MFKWGSEDLGVYDQSVLCSSSAKNGPYIGADQIKGYETHMYISSILCTGIITSKAKNKPLCTLTIKTDHRVITCGGLPSLPLPRYMQAALTIQPPPRVSPPQTCAHTTPKAPYTTTRAASAQPDGSKRSRKNPARDRRRLYFARVRRDAHSRSQARWASSQKTGSWPADSWMWPKT